MLYPLPTLSHLPSFTTYFFLPPPSRPIPRLKALPHLGDPSALRALGNFEAEAELRQRPYLPPDPPLQTNRNSFERSLFRDPAGPRPQRPRTLLLRAACCVCCILVCYVLHFSCHVWRFLCFACCDLHSAFLIEAGSLDLRTSESRILHSANIHCQLEMPSRHTAPYGDRAHDHTLTKRMLCQLS